MSVLREARATVADSSTEVARKVKAQQVHTLFGNAVPGALSGLMGTVGLAYILIAIEDASQVVTLTWAVAVALAYLAQLSLYFGYRRWPNVDSQTWIRGFTAVGLVTGLLWGCLVAAISMSGVRVHELFTLFISSAMAVASSLTFGCVLPVFLARFITANVPYVLWCLYDADPFHIGMAILAAIYTAMIVRLVKQYNRDMVDMFRLRFENEALVGDLRAQTDAANLANITKSRFLASASHDLRQPVHALSLFVGALQGRQMDTEAKRLIGLVDRSIEALDNLFVSLLDISKLDAGVVQPRPLSFRLQILLERVCRDFEMEARAKGLRLILVPCSQIVFADPILLERILRNLVANAVRYTMRGRVLVGCRRRGGRLGVEVHDSGPGIAPAEREQVFQEFYQLDNPERDRSKGLGLGLAIVKRHAELLGYELTLKSEVGRGSTFAVAIPMTTAPPSDITAVPAPSATAAAGSLILVVDDEIAIQEAMRALLTSWGFEVVAAGATDDMLKKLPSLSRPPDLIVCDYRLRAGENGIGAIDRLRAEYAKPIPALLITGDTAPDRLQEAEASGLPLLHKPIHNDRLRTMVGELLRGGEALSPG